ncbi:MAG: magnesium chelatase, partial [Candidatus Lokiarchaeota archaeon]|nr:magnesium chelatase [Candidatus Lokiarchaeota archaeon]
MRREFGKGDLRPQIADRLGLDVKIKAPRDSKLRAEISRRVINFDDNPKEFVKDYEVEQDKLRQKIIKAREILKDVQIPSSVYEFVSQIVSELEIFSQRADITFIRCARTHAALNSRNNIIEEDLN